MAEETCGHPIVHREGEKVWTTPCARKKGHKGSRHRDAEYLEADKAKARAKYDALSDEERSEQNRRKNRNRSDRQ